MFATKHDFLPKQYIQKLAFVFEKCEPMSILEVRDIIRNDLPSVMRDLFVDVEENPIACATIAQVHRASISGTAQSVALKVKNVKSQNLMKSDMANMLLVSKIMDLLNIQLPFDHTSVLLEYKSEVCPPEIKLSLSRRPATGTKGV